MPDTPIVTDGPILTGGPILTDEMRALLDATDVGFLTVARGDGSPHVSCVYHLRDGDRVLVTTTAERVKARAVERTGRATYSVHGDAKPYPSFSVEGSARILRVGIAEVTTALFRKILGGEPDPVTDETLASIDRVILELTPTRAYAVAHL